MRVAVVGLGGVGGYIAANFAKAGVDVIGFARGEHLNAVQTHGLQIVEDERCWESHLDARALDDLDGYFEGSFDAVLFCVKSYDLVESYEHIKSHIDEKTILLSFSNGVTNGDTLRKLSNSRVLDGCVYILSHIEKAGVVRKKGKVFAAVFGGEIEAVQTLSSLFEKAQLRFKTPEDIERAIWKKYIFIASFATLTSYYNESIGYIYEHKADEARGLLQEIADVAKDKGIDLEEEIQKALNTASKVPYDSSTSMHLDYKNQKRVELESLSGYIAKYEKVETPLMQKMYEGLFSRAGA
ncbi:MAG: 2-dehydropantoate 2-reductase [Campylobacterota bacterium]|nr:2-dehydropantoate 2-reductase [Campylobacterota bacterium]